MFRGDDLTIFERYRKAGSHAFSNNLVSEVDKDRYLEIHNSIKDVAQRAIDNSENPSEYKIKASRFYRDGGVQGQRPHDLWVSVINEESDPLGNQPQVHMIVSDLGIEMGFGVATHESEYSNLSVKIRNRAIVPVLYRKLPVSSHSIITNLDQGLSSDGFWRVGEKSRQTDKSDFGSVSDLISFLKSPASGDKGGGAIYRLISPADIDATGFDLEAEFTKALDLFRPLMRSLTPNARESVQLEIQG